MDSAEDVTERGRPAEWPWWALFAGLIVFLAACFAKRFTGAYTNVVDFNAVVWSQAAHNFLRAGLRATAGVPAGFYFGPLPIPPEHYYVHHPPLLALTLAGLFRIFGEHEWTARLLPDACSLASAVLLACLVRECRGTRAAIFAIALFVAMPMELFYGQMVNFEPVTLCFLLAGVIAQRHWEQTGSPRWRLLMLAPYIAAMETAWLGYFFVLAFAIDLIARRRWQMGALIITLALLCGALFLIHIRIAMPTAWQDLASAFRIRASHSTPKGSISLSQWSTRAGASLLVHIPWPFWLLASAGAALLVIHRHESGISWLGRASLIFFLMNTLYVVLFRNASYIHSYAAFYFMLPVAICGGVTLDVTANWLNARLTGFPAAGTATALLLCAILCSLGWRAEARLEGQALLLDGVASEPENLIPQLGRLIRAEFPRDAKILCNFNADCNPHLSYYAQRTILNNLPDRHYWEEALAYVSRPRGGVIWLGDPHAREVLDLMGIGSRRTVVIGNLDFVIWSPPMSL